MIKHHRPDVLVLIEPRVSGIKADDICLKIGFDNWIRVEAVGFSDRILIFLNKEVGLDVLHTNTQFILVKVSFDGGPFWIFSVVYRSLNGMLRGKR